MDHRLVMHPARAARLFHQAGQPLLEHAGPDPAEHVRLRAPLQNDAADPPLRQELRQQQARGAASDDRDFGPHLSPPQLAGAAAPPLAQS